MFEELENLPKENGRRINMPEDAKCYVCGSDRSTSRLRRYNNYCLCEKHYNQLEKYHKIIDASPRKNKVDPKTLRCCICGDLKMGSYEGKPYCRKHYIQMVRHGKLIPTIYDPNEWIDCGDYYECILKDKKGNETGRTKIDKEDYPLLKNFKIYRSRHQGKAYAIISQKGTCRKIFVHRYLMGIKNEKYTIDKVVDHINGDGLDNRRSNLRICNQHQNSINMRKKGKIVGVKFIKSYNRTNTSKWMAEICSNYRTIYLGYYDTQEEAVLARLKKEKELCGEFGPNKDFYYLLNHPSPIEETKRVLNSFKNSSDGV